MGNIPRGIVVTAFGMLIGSGVFAQSNGAVLIFGGTGHRTFLGCLTCNSADPASVMNDFGTHAWSNKFGTWGTFGEFASEFSTYSACNEFASDPPVLVDRSGAFYGRLSINEYRSNGVCAIMGNEKICRALKVMCAAQ